MRKDSASAIWSKLEGRRSALMTRLERYAALTVKSLLRRPGETVENSTLATTFQSTGAQGLKHVTNKVMSTLFRPGHPFFRLSLDDDGVAMALSKGLNPDDTASSFAAMERKAVKQLETKKARPKLFQCIMQAVALGNCLYELRDQMRVYSIRNWVCKRDIYGNLMTLVIKECVFRDELDPGILELLPPAKLRDGDSKAEYYRVLQRKDDGSVTEEHWVDEFHVATLDATYSPGTVPYHVLTWHLPEDSDYGTGLVEDIEGDLEALNAVSEAVITGSISGCDWRYLINPAGVTQVNDFKNTRTGDAVAGTKGDIDTTSGNNASGVQQATAVMDVLERRVSKGFLMMSGVVRNAERVTAEEVRAQAAELESAYGHSYVNLGIQLQDPIAKWVCNLQFPGALDAGMVDLKVITGMDALTRNAELEAFRLALNDLAPIAATPPEMIGQFNPQKVLRFVGDGRGIDLSPLLYTPEELQQQQEARQQQEVAQNNAMAAGEAAAQSSV